MSADEHISREQFQATLSGIGGSSYGRALRDPGCAAGMCGDATGLMLEELGGRATGVAVPDPAVRRKMKPHPNVESLDDVLPTQMSHTVWEGNVEGTPTVVDWTARQFNPRARVPEVVPSERYHPRWQRRRDETELFG